MRGIEHQRDQRRRNLGIEVAARLLLLRFGQTVPCDEPDAVRRQPRNHLIPKAFGLPLKAFHQPPPHLTEQVRPLRRRALPQNRNPLHEELVQVRGEDR